MLNYHEMHYCIPRTKYVRGYYGLVVVPPRPPPRPQTLHRSHDNLKKSLSDCFHILYVDWYRWEDAWEARWAQSNYLWATQAPPNSPKCEFFSHWGPYMKNWWLYFSLVINLSALLWGLSALKFSFTWVRRKAPPGPPKYEKKYYFFIFWV